MGILVYKKHSLNLPFISPTPGHITIGASSIVILNTVENTQQKLIDTYSNVVDMDFNLFVAEGNYTSTQPGIFTTFKDKNFWSRLGTLDLNSITSYVNALKKYDNLKMWFIIDEPKSDDLEKVSDCMKLIHQLDNTRISWSNIIPNKMGGSLELVPSGIDDFYLKWMQEVNKIVYPSLWSFDNYPFKMIYGTNDIVYDQKAYNNIIQAYHNLSKETNRPFWSFCLACQIISVKDKNNINGEWNYNYPAPDLGQLRVEAFTALAYGAQGIIFWPIRQRTIEETFSSISSNEFYTNAILNYDGSINQKQKDISEQVIKEIKELDKYFYNCKITNYLLCTSSNNDSINFGPINSINLNKQYGVLISLFTKDNNKYFAIVNQNAFEKQTLNLSFNQKVKLEYSLNQDNLNNTIQENILTITTEPGECLIFSY